MLKSIKNVIIIILVFLVFLTLLDLFFNPIYCFKLNDLPQLKWILVNKSQIYISISIFFASMIFLFQELNQKEIFHRLNDNVEKISPLNKLDDIKVIMYRWLKEDTANVFIFYFPYSIHPGFWYDTGNEFSYFLDQLNTDTDHNYRSKLIFVGPDKSDSIINDILSNLESKLNLEFVNLNIAPNNAFSNLHGFGEYEDSKKKSFIDSISKDYTKKFNDLKDKADSKNKKFKIIPLNKNDIKNLPSFSFVLKVNKNKAEDMILIDTFNTLAENNIKAYVKDLGLNSILSNGDLEKLFRHPETKLINNPKVANLFLTTFLESCCENNKLNTIITELKSLN